MGWRLATSLEVLRNQVNAAYPNRNKASDGGIGDAAHAATASDHNPNAAGVVCAYDLTHDPANGFDSYEVADNLLANRHPDLKYIVSNRRIAGEWSGWQWQYYGGSDPHTNHMHVSVGIGSDGRSVPPYDDANEWAITGGSGPTPPPPTPTTETATVTVDSLFVRALPNIGAPLSGSRELVRGNTFQVAGRIAGQNVAGNDVWLVSTKGNYVWSGGTDLSNGDAPSPSAPGLVTVLYTLNVRTGPDMGSEIVGKLNPGEIASAVELVTGGNYVLNGESSNRWYRSKQGHFYAALGVK